MDGGYNDKGFRLLGNTAAVNYTLFVLSGVGKGRAYGGRIGLTPFSNPYSLGAQEAPRFEVGASYLYDSGESGKAQLRAGNLDVAVRFGRFNTQAEFVRKDDLDVEEFGGPARRSGFHLTQAFDAGNLLGRPAVAYCRFEHFRKLVASANEISDDAEPGAVAGRTGLNRLTGGLQWTLSELFILKMEYLQFIHTPANSLDSESLERRSFYAQLVFRF